MSSGVRGSHREGVRVGRINEPPLILFARLCARQLSGGRFRRETLKKKRPLNCNDTYKQERRASAITPLQEISFRYSKFTFLFCLSTGERDVPPRPPPLDIV